MADGKLICKVKKIGKDRAQYCGVLGNSYEVQIIRNENGSRVLRYNGNGKATERLTAEIYFLAPNNPDIKTKIGEIFTEQSELFPAKFASKLESFVRNFPDRNPINQRAAQKQIPEALQ